MADTTARGYPYPEGSDVWRDSAEADGGAPWKNLAEAVDADVAAVEAAASGGTAGVAGDLADHEAATTSVHGIADTSVLVTTARQITAGTGLTGGGTLASDRTIGIAAGGVGTTQLADDAVTSGKIAAGAVGSSDIATGAVGTTQLADDAVTSAKIANGAVGTTDLADSAVTSAKIADGTIVNADIAAGAAIDPTKIAGTAVVQARTVTGTGALTGGGTLAADRTLDVADGGIGTAELADNAVTTAKIANGAVTLAKLSGTDSLVASAAVGNLLTTEQATCTGGLAAFLTTVTYASNQATVTTTSASAASATATVAGIVPGLWYTFGFDIAASSGSRGWRVAVTWRDAGNVQIGATEFSPLVPSGTARRARYAAQAPVGAASVQMSIYGPAGAISDAVVVEKLVAARGIGADWSPPTVPTTGSIQTPWLQDPGNVTLNAAQPLVAQTGGSATWTLPDPAVNRGAHFDLHNIGTGTVTVSRGAYTVDGALTSPTVPHKGWLRVVSDGATWRVLDGYRFGSAAGNGVSWNPQIPGWSTGIVDADVAADAAISASKLSGVIRAAITTSATSVAWSSATPVLTISDTATVTLPAASANTGSVATIINIGTGTVTINRTSPDVIAGSLTTTSLPGRGTLRLVSDGTGWRVIDGTYSSSTVGLATYEWNHVAPGWRLIGYDSGVRSVAWENAVWDASTSLRIRRHLSHVTVAGLATSTAGGTGWRDAFLTLPLGFRSTSYTPVGSGILTSGGVLHPTLPTTSVDTSLLGFSSAAAGSPTSIAAAATITFSGSWSTPTATLPASLPGTEITAPV